MAIMLGRSSLALIDHTRAAYVCGAIVASALAVVPWALPRQAHAGSVAAASMPEAAPGVDPVLVRVPTKIQVAANQPALVRISGQHFEAGASVTFEGTFYVYTLGPFAPPAATPTTIEFDAAAVQDGTYQLSVRNPSGRRSNAQPIAVVSK